MHEKIDKKIILAIRQDTRLFSGLSGNYYVFVENLIPILDVATDESNEKCNSYLWEKVEDEAERVYQSHNKGKDENWKKAKENLAGKLFSCFREFQGGIDKVNEHDFLFKARKALELGSEVTLRSVPRDDRQIAERALKYIIQNLPKSE